MDVDESTVSINVQQKTPKTRNPFLYKAIATIPTTNMVIESSGDMKMTDQQIGRSI